MKAAETISDQTAKSLLAAIGMTIGAWHDISPIKGKRAELPVASYKAPGNALELFCFAQHITTWIPDGDWKLLIADNSTALAKDEGILLHQGTSDSAQAGAFNKLFRFGNDHEENFERNIAIAHAIFLLLMFEGHAYLTSSNSNKLQILGIQDGYAYLYSEGVKISEAEELLQNFNRGPLTTPKWVSAAL
ncbi:hypothetical protein [Pseudomonas sp. GD03944]|uniref:hypothetical protein n=1 Tax=Pseudomonas sp. GD03944 TaxID=2975409 RepID=UPI0024482998|nr:hypothetical protein [Pseudomonas sp. GD03944]MDH1262927.1 hypothetical protein [Pseudomonas sp. GD03944]